MPFLSVSAPTSRRKGPEGFLPWTPSVRVKGKGRSENHSEDQLIIFEIKHGLEDDPKHVITL